MSAPSQSSMFDVPRSRWSDPETSRQAAESVSLSKVSKVQEMILAALIRPMTDEQLVDRVHELWPERRVSPQSIRSRRAELVRKGLVEASPQVRSTKFGRSSVVWKLS